MGALHAERCCRFCVFKFLAILKENEETRIGITLPQINAFTVGFPFVASRDFQQEFAVQAPIPDTSA